MSRFALANCELADSFENVGVAIDSIRRLTTGPEIAEALPLLVRGRAPEDQQSFLSMVREVLRSATPRDFVLLSASSAGKRLGVIAAKIGAGSFAELWPAVLETDAEACLAGELVAAMLGELRRNQVAVAQAIVPVDLDDHSLAAGGLSKLGKLAYMVAESEVFPSSFPESEITFEPVDPNDERLHEVMTATYVNSLDCPAIDGWREPKKVVESYLHTGIHSPELWSLIFWKRSAVGCLIQTQHPEHAVLELIYFGISPNFRGKRFGAMATQFALWQAGKFHADRVVLAVDALNAPAITSYEHCGFRIWNTQAIWGARLESPVRENDQGNK